jgi:hypothetical protein
MKKFLSGLLAVLGVGLIGSLVYAAWLGLKLEPTYPPLQTFRVVFEDGGFLDLKGDYVKSEGPCNVIYTNDKPVVYLCFNHMLIPRGPVKPELAPPPAAPRLLPPASREALN